jgi:hypothetical protein
MTPRLPFGFVLLRYLFIAMVLGGFLAGCSSDDDEDDPTATPVPPTPTSTAAAATVAPTVVTGAGQIVTDGICQANLPDDWVDDTTGRGTTSSGAKYALFGGRVRSDDAWKEAVELVKSQAEAKEGANVTETDNSIRVDLADNRGFEYRVRFDTNYCDFSVTSTSPIPEEERGLWDGILASLAPVAASS